MREATQTLLRPARLPARAALGVAAICASPATPLARGVVPALVVTRSVGVASISCTW